MFPNVVSKKLTDHDLSQFCITVREKKDWQTKIFDETLVLKWTIEAELSPLGSKALTGEALEAVRFIISFSFVLQLLIPHVASSDVQCSSPVKLTARYQFHQA
jgi:hypothetical protein